MKMFLIGATGMIGSRVLDEALARGHEVIAGARKAPGPRSGVTPVAVDANDSAALARAAKGADVIVAATSPRNTGDTMAEATGLAQAVIEAARATGLRLVQVGGAGSLSLPDGSSAADAAPEIYRAESLAMRSVRDLVRASDADWTLVVPSGQIGPGKRTGEFRLGGSAMLFDADGKSEISAEDFAVAILDEIERPAHRREMFTVAY